MVTVSLLSFIVLGLLAMFHQTQRAFRSSMTQTDVLETGRALTEMLAREFEQASPSGYPDIFLNGARVRATNFFVEPSPGFGNTAPGGPFYQGLSGSVDRRTNFVQRFFFLTRLNQDVIGTGYQVVPDTNGCVGTLYRYSATNVRSAPINLSSNFLVAAKIALDTAANGDQVTNMNRIADGIVHLRLRAFATNGSLIVPITLPGNILTNGFALGPYALSAYTNVANTIVARSPGLDSQQANCYFMKDSVPAYVELELGVVEPQILQKYRSFGNFTAPLRDAQRNYLSNHTAQVHIFRQRVALQNVDFTAYP